MIADIALFMLAWLMLDIIIVCVYNIVKALYIYRWEKSQQIP